MFNYNYRGWKRGGNEYSLCVKETKEGVEETDISPWARLGNQDTKAHVTMSI